MSARNCKCIFLQYGEIEEMNVCDNLGDHLVGNVYIKYRREEDAEKACKVLNNRWYDGMYIFSLLYSRTLLTLETKNCSSYREFELTRVVLTFVYYCRLIINNLQ